MIDLNLGDRFYDRFEFGGIHLDCLLCFPRFPVRFSCFPAPSPSFFGFPRILLTFFMLPPLSPRFPHFPPDWIGSERSRLHLSGGKTLISTYVGSCKFYSYLTIGNSLWVGWPVPASNPFLSQNSRSFCLLTVNRRDRKQTAMRDPCPGLVCSAGVCARTCEPESADDSGCEEGGLSIVANSVGAGLLVFRFGSTRIPTTQRPLHFALCRYRVLVNSG